MQFLHDAMRHNSSQRLAFITNSQIQNIHSHSKSYKVSEYSATQKGREYLRSLKLPGVKDCLDTIDFLDTKIQEMDNQIKILAGNDKYAKHLITIPGISYYAALLIFH